MIYIFGDSHANFNFKNLNINNINLYQNSITMYRIGRDKQIINFDNNYNNKDNIFILCYGEVDCRNHIGKQILLGRELTEICENLVFEYIDTIKKTIHTFNKIILCSIIPPMKKELYEIIHGPITHEFPFIGDDNQRVTYTKLVNGLLKKYCEVNNFIFLDIYDHYCEVDGTLKYELSDKCVHIEENDHIHKKILELI
jgi:hypothetical protein